jgi:excisionase family DNA binding protein
MTYVTPREAARILGVNSRTLSRWEESGKIKAIKTPSGQRRYDLDSYIKEQSRDNTTNSTARTVLYARVSTSSQRDDLTRQAATLTERYPGCEVITEVGSGLNFRRRKLLAILERVIRGDIQMLVVAHRDRLARFGFDLIEWLCSQFGCTVMVLYQQKHSPQTELVQDMLSIVHCFSARLYGLRKYEKQLRQDQEIQTQIQAQSEQVEVQTATK